MPRIPGQQLKDKSPARAERTPNGTGPAGWGPRVAGDLLMGLRFYSRLPLGKAPHEKPDLGRIALVLPFASLVIGLIPALILAGAEWLGISLVFAAALAVAASVIVTGAMAEDALADAADGLFGGTTVDRRLEIMKDSRHGTYGVAALCLFLVLRVAAIGTAPNGFVAAGMWLAAMVLARSGALWLTIALPPARSDGASAGAGRVGRTAFGLGAIVALLVSVPLAGFVVGVPGLAVALLLATGTVLGWTWLCRRLIGGQTGDLIGALQALLEIAVLAAFMIFI